MHTLDTLIQRYVGERMRRSEITQGTARNITNHLRSFSASHGNRTLQQLGPKAIDRWLEDTANLAPSTRALRLSTIHLFARWMVMNDIIAKDFMLYAPKIRRPRLQSRDMNGDDAEAILAVCRTDREQLIVWLMYGAGLRCVEVSRLDVDDFDPAGYLHVRGKAGHEREVPLGPPVRLAIQRYLAAHSVACGPLIQREDTCPGRLGPERISGLVGRLVRKAGVKRRNYDGRSAHGLRACAASDLADVCPDPRVLQQFLGHAGLANLDRYLRRLQLDRVRDAVELRWAS